MCLVRTDQTENDFNYLPKLFSSLLSVGDVNVMTLMQSSYVSRLVNVLR